MNTLTFKPKPGRAGEYTAHLNERIVDGCDINKKRSVTQAHVVIASAICTLQTQEIEVEIEGGEKTYSIEELLSMSKYMYEEKGGSYSPLFYTRIYDGL